jgi:hypothetical protein
MVVKCFTWQAPVASIKKITAVINSITKKASTSVKVSKKCLTITKALAYYTTELITTIKCYILQTPGACTIKLFTAVIVAVS